MPDNWENLIVSISTSAPTGTLKFDDVSSSLMNEELRQKSVTENQAGEALTIADCGRKIDRTRQGRSKSRGRSNQEEAELLAIIVENQDT